MPPRISSLIGPLREVLGGLSIRERIPQVEVAVGDAADVLVLRVLEAPTDEDAALLRAFADRHAVQLYLQPRGPDSVRPFHPEQAADLHYTLPEFGLTVGFLPTDFTQVNHAVNRVLVRRALKLLDPRPGERIADMFCGLGNFTLAIARSGATVLGVEGSTELVARAVGNARENGLEAVAEFRAMDLFGIDGAAFAALGRFDRMLIDPPRDGAVELVKSIEDTSLARIVYVSCNPATLARDAAVLVHTKGYRLSSAGVVNMFPHTSHVESIALFERDG
ncbi:MAG: methyltransferase domain-containing protein, partial [Burkholderiales bacterium]|nr:methyltransferase domain-containing protein [Burkholderiales bacterium]